MLFLFCFVTPFPHPCLPCLKSHPNQRNGRSDRSGPGGQRTAGVPGVAGLWAPLEKGRLETYPGCLREGATATGGPSGRDSRRGGTAPPTGPRADRPLVTWRKVLERGRAADGVGWEVLTLPRPHSQTGTTEAYVRGCVSSASSPFPATLHPQTPPYTDAGTWGGSE